MAANEYYNIDHGHGGYNTNARPEESIYEASPYQSGTVPIAYPHTQSPRPPSYTSQPPPATYQRYDSSNNGAGSGNSTISAGGFVQRPTHTSPFDTDFDDNIYPANNSPQTMSQTALPSNSASTFAQDTGYYGASHSNDNIPLQDRPSAMVGTIGAPKPDASNDHVYDAEPGYNQQATQKRRRVQWGQLGMWSSNKKRIPFMVYLFTAIQVGVFIGELVKNSQLTGSVIMTKPQFNPMIGPSTYVLINMGARFVPCMHEITEAEIEGDGIAEVDLQTIPWPCPNTTSTDATDPSNQCTLGELCGFDASQTNDNPNQWFRFIVPIFLHAGIVHIAFNMVLQLTIAREMESAIGPIRFFLVYMSAGIFGFVMGGNYGGTGFASVGASGSLFGILALTLLDLLYSWKDRKSPLRELVTIFIEMVIAFGLGLLPGLDNFAHIGGFVMGLALGISVLHSPNALRMRIGDDTPYTSMVGHSANEPPSFLKNPIGFFKGRKPLWWVWWLIRAGALLLVIIGFILLLENFYVTRNTCSWCKYLSCIPINDWCDSQNLQFSSSTSSSSKRDFAMQGFSILRGVSGFS